MIGKDILKIVWEDEGQRLSSGFVLAGGNEEVHRLKKEIERLIGVKETRKEGP
ncbi:MAG: hypothetical protein QHH14_02230 [Clostridiales bacterium]|jgi:hypothetical protein|nr:hypothetical protein [Clostridiales bacterium]